MMATLIDQPLLAALTALLGLGALFGALLGFAAIRFRVEGNPISEQIKCCCLKLSAGSVVTRAVGPIQRPSPRATPSTNVPPAARSIQALADLLDVEPQFLDAEHGVEKEPVVAPIRRTNASAAQNAFKPAR